MMLNNRAFSLVELSVTLIIIGLLAVGIVAGSRLLNTTALNKDISNLEKYKTSVVSFISTYRQYPGDFAKAAQFFGNNCLGDNGGSDICSGDGDGLIESPAEFSKFWLHLKAANIVNPEFTISSSSTPTDEDIFPKTNYDNYGRYAAHHYSSFSRKSGSSLDIAVAERNYLVVGGLDIAADVSNMPLLGNLLPKDALRYDKKIDDAHPSEGNLIAFIGSNYAPLGVSGSCLTDLATYANYENSKTCVLAYKLDRF